jgi:hypothetical protein
MVFTSASASQEDRLCMLVTVGGRADGTRELIAVGGSDVGFWGALSPMNRRRENRAAVSIAWPDDRTVGGMNGCGPRSSGSRYARRVVRVAPINANVEPDEMPRNKPPAAPLPWRDARHPACDRQSRLAAAGSWS